MDLITILQRQIDFQQGILNDTDKYIVRSIELSQPVNADTLAVRASARQAIMEYRVQIEALQAQE